MELRRTSLIERNLFKRNGSGSGKHVLNKYQLNIVLIELLIKGIQPIVPVKPKVKFIPPAPLPPPRYHAAKKYASNSTRRPSDAAAGDDVLVFSKHANKQAASYKVNRHDIPHLLSALKSL